MFKLIKSIENKKTGEVHFRRWSIISTKSFSIWLHMFTLPDKDHFLHDHPWNFSSLIIWGGYREEYAESYDDIKNTKFRNRKPFNFKRYLATDCHRIVKVFGKSYSIIFAGKRRRAWGYRTPGGEFMNNEQYRERKKKGEFDNLYPKYKCPKCDDWFHMPYKNCKCEDNDIT